MEHPLTFDSGCEQLVGIMNTAEHAPAARDVGLVFAHSGSRGRLGNTFHYPFLARRFAAAGVASLRFDPAGLGDSSGAISTGPTRDLYREIQSGRFVGDTLAAIEEFRRRHGSRKLYLFGVCGGAATALLTAAEHPSVDGAILLSLPVLLDPGGMGSVRRVPKTYARESLRGSYARKLVSLQAWARLATGRSDVRNIANLVRSAIASNRKPDDSRLAATPQLNARVVRAFDELTGGGKSLLVVFGSNDAFGHEWQAEFADVLWEERPAYARHVDVRRVPGNHMFTLREWQEHVAELVLDWIAADAQRRHGGRSASSASRETRGVALDR
jgi:pimeloyl-ACP methyl ester carboxylesterase